MNATINRKSSWNDSYSINVPEIDKQHRRLFDIYDRLSDMLNYGVTTDYFDVRNIITELVDYTKYHFETEEDFMRDIGYKGFDNHVKEHKLFVKKISDFTLACKYKNPLLVNNMVLFIKKWLISHILQSDSELKNL